LLGTLATFGFVTVYILVSIAAPLYLKARGCLTNQAIVISALAVIAMGLALLGSLYPVPATPYSLLPYVYAVLLGVGFAWSTAWSARTPTLAAEGTL